ncbi:MAG: hypothetical protein KA444_03980, partial [Bacteroidia bacterium]|nr:hypothetical protein [Bacteroidia bacterium]
MHKINLQNEIDQQLKKLSLQFVALSQSAGTDSAEKMQEFIAGIRTLYEQALSLQHFSAIQAL